MTQVCQICSNPKRLQIDREIVSGKNLTNIARKYDVPYHSLYGHKENHLSRQLVQAFQKEELAESMDLLSTIEDLINKANKIFQRNYAKQKDGLALKAIDSQKGSIELLCKISAYLHEARSMELRNRREEWEEEQQAESNMKLSRLSDSELDIFEKLVQKANGLNDDEIVSSKSEPFFDNTSLKTSRESIEKNYPYEDIPSPIKVDSRPDYKGLPKDNSHKLTMKRTNPPGKQEMIAGPIDSIVIPGSERGPYEATVSRRKLRRKLR